MFDWMWMGCANVQNKLLTLWALLCLFIQQVLRNSCMHAFRYYPQDVLCAQKVDFFFQKLTMQVNIFVPALFTATMPGRQGKTPLFYF